MADGSLADLFWRVIDALDYSLTQARFGIIDTVCGPEPESTADQQLGCDQERS